MTPNASRVLAALAGRGPRIATNAALQLNTADLADLAGALGSPSGAGGGSCGGAAASPFAGYAPAGRLTVKSTGPSSIEKDDLNVVGSMLPEGSIIVLDDNTNGSHVVEVASDGRPQAVGNGGVGFSIMDLGNQNAPGLYLATRATRSITVTVQFKAGSVAGDEVVFQVLQPGGSSIAAAACAI